MIKKILICLATVGTCSLAQADEPNWRFYVGVGMSNGGDTIFSGELVNQTTGLVQPFEIKAGTATEFRAGADLRITDWLTLQASVGHSDEAPMGINGSLNFTKTPVELLGFVNVTDGLRIGGGIRKTHANMTGTGLADGWGGLGGYSSTRGSVIEAQYLFGLSETGRRYQDNLFGISLRVVNESFSKDSVTFSGHHYELGGAYYY